MCSMKCVNGSFTHCKTADCWSIICQYKKTALTDANLVFPDPFLCGCMSITKRNGGYLYITTASKETTIKWII